MGEFNLWASNYCIKYLKESFTLSSSLVILYCISGRKACARVCVCVKNYKIRDICDLYPSMPYSIIKIQFYN